MDKLLHAWYSMEFTYPIPNFNEATVVSKRGPIGLWWAPYSPFAYEQQYTPFQLGLYHVIWFLIAT